jgi:hypothetical protein
MNERHPIALTMVLSGVKLLAVLDGLAAALALPAIGADLGLDAAGRAWVLNATSVALAGGLLVSGRAGDLFGRRPVLLTGLGLLGAGSLVCTLAPTGGLLLAGRVLLGIGAAVAYPSSLSLTSSLFPDEPWRTRAFTASAVAGALGSLGGAVYGGVVTGLLGWRWVFGLTVPLTVVLLVLGWLLVPRDEIGAGPRRRPLDLTGAVLATVAVSALVAGIIGLGTSSMRVTMAGLCLAVAAGLVAALAVWERGQPDPLLPGAVLRSRRLLGGSGGNVATSAMWSVVVFVLGQHLQEAGWSPAEAGLAILPASLGIVVAGFVLVPWSRRRFGSVRTAVGGLLGCAACVAWLALAPADPSYVTDLLVPLLLLGILIDAAHISITEHTLKGGVEGAEATSAAVFEASTHVGGAVSVALYAAVLAAGVFAPAYLVAAGFGVLGALAVGALQREPHRTRSRISAPP